MKTTIALVTLGILISLGGLWGGAWLIVRFPYGTAYNFPAFMTAALFSIGGAVIAAAAIIYSADRKS